jgi:hypothetical protein
MFMAWRKIVAAECHMGKKRKVRMGFAERASPEKLDMQSISCIIESTCSL